MKTRKLSGTTNADGDLTVNDTLSICGELIAVEYMLGSFAATTDVTLTYQNGEGNAQTLLTLTDATASKMYNVRHLVHGETGTALTGTAGGDRCEPVINGTLRMVIAQGGDAKTGGVIVYYED